MIKRCRGILFVLALLGAGLGARAVDVPIKFTRAGDGFTPRMMHEIKPSLTPLPGVKLPKLNANPIFGILRLGDKDIALALDQPVKGKAYSRLYIDLNGNGDLTDDTPIDGSPGNDFMSLFPPLEVKVSSGGAALPFRFTVSSYDFGRAVAALAGEKTHSDPDVEQFKIMCNTSCVYRGEFDLGGKHFKILLSDSNFNGVCGDSFSPSSAATAAGASVITTGGDSFYISEAAELAEENHLMLGNILVLDSQPYRVAFDPAGVKLSLTPCTEGLAKLALPAKTRRAFLYSEDGKTAIMIPGAGAEISVPAGKYRVAWYELEGKDSEGDTWRISAQADDKTPWIEVAAGGKTALKFGEPFTPVVGLNNAGASAAAAMGVASLNFYLHDTAGMIAGDVAHTAGNKTKIALVQGKPVLPKYTIKNADGTLAAQGQFEYG